jgi:hypothetical protein
MKDKNVINVNSLQLDSVSFGVKRDLNFSDIFMIESKIAKYLPHAITSEAYRNLKGKGTLFPMDFFERFKIVNK